MDSDEDRVTRRLIRSMLSAKEEDSEEYGDLDMEEEEEGEGDDGGDAVYVNDSEDGGEGVLVFTEESIHEDSVESANMQGEEVNGTFVRVEEGDEEGDEEEGETGEAVDNGRDDVYYDSEHGNHDNSDGEGDGESQSSDNTNTDKLMKWAILVVLMAITIMFLISVVSSYLWFD